MLKKNIKNQRNKEAVIIGGLLGILIFLSIFPSSFAQQTGATITNRSTVTKPANFPQNRTDPKGTITTLQLSAEQQDIKWKAYVGNVSSTFVLDDEIGDSIYQWTVNSFTGQVYITRNETITWTSVSCASAANKLTEDTRIGHNSQSADSVNRTFSQQTHNNLTVGSSFIGNNTCFSTVTWQNDASHQLNSSAPWQEILLWDSTSTGKMIYSSFVENDKVGYKSDGTTYDFQAIIPDDALGSNPNLRYFFYLELS
jgi:hypothetical protein